MIKITLEGLEKALQQALEGTREREVRISKGGETVEVLGAKNTVRFTYAGNKLSMDCRIGDAECVLEILEKWRKLGEDKLVVMEVSLGEEKRFGMVGKKTGLCYVEGYGVF